MIDEPSASSRRPRRSFVVHLCCKLVVVLLLAAGFASSAKADKEISSEEKNKAIAAVREGNHLLDLGKPQEALTKFKQAHDLVGGDKLLYNIGQAQKEIEGMEVEAYQAFDTFLNKVTNASADTVASARRHRTELSAKIAFLSVKTRPPAANVLLDSQLLGLAPLESPVAVGRHELKLSLDGYRNVEETVILQAGQTNQREVTLEPVATALAPPIPSTVVSEPSPLPMVTAASTEVGKAPPFYETWWFWTGAAAVLVTAIVLVAVSGGGDESACNGTNCLELK